MKSRLFGALSRWLVPTLGILGFASLSFLLGSAVMHFKLPPFLFLNNSFKSGQAWVEKNRERSRQQRPAQSAGWLVRVRDRPGKTFDGFTLYCRDLVPAAFLVNMDGKVVHQWAVPFSQAWPERRPAHVTDPVDDSVIYFSSCHLYANGDLLAVYQTSSDTPYGYGLVKINKDSEVIWRYSRNVHHDVDVGGDGTIYALTQQFVQSGPSRLDLGPPPYLVDQVAVLSPDGSELKVIPILDALQNSRYAPLLAGKVGNARTAAGLPRSITFGKQADVLHTNCVKVLRREMAPKFPMFKEGQLLISMRQLDTIAVLDPQTDSIVWAAQGPWRRQHCPRFLDNGRLLIFDNVGALTGSRVLEYDPRTQAVPWSYPDHPSPEFDCRENGMCQRLPNGNTLIVDPWDLEIREISPSKELLWQMRTPAVIYARRYSLRELEFLSPDERPRP